MKNAAEGGHFEIQGARMAMAKAHDSRVREYARRLIDDHAKADQQLKPIARARGVTLPAEPSADQQAKLQSLRGLKGNEFDRRFVEVLGLEAHRATIEKFRNEISDGTDPQVKSFAQKVLPKLEQHLQIAQNLQGRVEGKDASGGKNDAGNRAAAGATAGAAAGATAANARVDNVDKGELKDAHEEISKAVQVVQEMKSEPRVTEALARAKGVFIMPTYGRGALGVGVQGGSGVLLVRQGEKRFSGPVFYNMGGISLGLQAGASAARSPCCS